jgi:hypothetical protein
MAQLSAAVARTYEVGDYNHLPVKSAAAIYQGSAVGLTSGYARQLTAGDAFGGFAENDVAAPSADGGANVRVRAKGRIQLAVGSLAVTDIGKPVYASDGDTFVLTQSTNTHIGRVVRFVSTGIGVVEFDATASGIGLLTALTDNSGGTASDTLADVPASYTEATLANQIASLAAKINAIIRQIT